jgi:hypothetical protein
MCVFEVKQNDMGILQRNITSLNVNEDQNNGYNTDNNDDINVLFHNSVFLWSILK